MEYNFLTLWEGQKKKEILDAALGCFSGDLEELVTVEANEQAYKVNLSKKDEEQYVVAWKSKKYTGDYYALLAADINGDNKEEIVIADSEGLKVFRWVEKEVKIMEVSLAVEKEVYLGTAKLGDKGLVLLVISNEEVVYYRVGKDSLEELSRENLPLAVDLALTADINRDGLKELLVYKQQEDKGKLISFAITNKKLEKLEEREVDFSVGAFAVGYVNGNPILLLVKEDGYLTINKLAKDRMIEVGVKDFPDKELYQLVSEVVEPGLVTMGLVPSLNKIKVIKASENGNVVVVTEKGVVLVGNLSKIGSENVLNPVTFIERVEESYDVDVSNVLELEGDILDVKTYLSSINEEVEKGKINIKGSINCKYLYRPKGEERILTGEQNFDFTNTINNENIDKEDWVEILTKSCQTTFNLKEENKYEFETKVCLEAQYYDQREVNFLTSLRGIRQDQFVETTIQVEEPIARRRKQVIVQGTVTSDVPVEKILETNARVRDVRVEALFNKAVIRGVLDVEILFVADTLEGDQPVFFLEREIPFNAFIDVPGLRPGMPVFVSHRVEWVKARLINETTIEVTAVVVLEAKTTVLKPIDVIIDVNGFVEDDIVVGNGDVVLGVGETLDVGLNQMDVGIDVGIDELEVEFPVGIAPINDIIARRQTQVLVEDIVDIPPQKPDVEFVLSVDTNVIVTEVRVIPDKVIIRGILRTTTRYVADTLAGDQPVHAVSADIPFTTFVDMPGVVPGTPVRVFPEVEYVKGRREDGRSIEIVAIIKALVQAFRRVRALVKA